MKKAIKILILLAMLSFAILWMFIIFKLSGMSSSNSNGKSTDIISIFIEDTLQNFYFIIFFFFFLKFIGTSTCLYFYLYIIYTDL